MWVILLRLANIGMLIDWLWFHGKRCVAWVGRWDDEPVVNHIVVDPVTQSIRNESTVYTDVAQETRDELNQVTYKTERRGRKTEPMLSVAQTIYYDRMAVEQTPKAGVHLDTLQQPHTSGEQKKKKIDPWNSGLYHKGF